MAASVRGIGAICGSSGGVETVILRVMWRVLALCALIWIFPAVASQFVINRDLPLELHHPTRFQHSCPVTVRVFPALSVSAIAYPLALLPSYLSPLSGGFAFLDLLNLCGSAIGSGQVRRLAVLDAAGASPCADVDARLCPRANVLSS